MVTVGRQFVDGAAILTLPEFRPQKDEHLQKTSGRELR